MEQKLATLREHIAQVVDLTRAAEVLAWDQETYMPQGGAAARADQISTLSGLAHELFIDEKVGALLEELIAAGLPYDSDDGSFVRVQWREYQKAVRLPTDLVVEMAKASALGLEAWRAARAQDDFSQFRPALEHIVELTLHKAEALHDSRSSNLYDALLDSYDPGLSYEAINAVFSALKPELIALVKAIAANQDAVDDSIVTGNYPEADQMAFGRSISEALGYDYGRGRLDKSTHPFSISFSPDDVRITTRYSRRLPESLMGTIHETGHAIYEQQVSKSLYRSGLDSGAGMSVHESQSRFYENILGRSRAFWEYWYPFLHDAFPEQLQGVEMEQFYRALNRSQPSFIRVEADEVTYGLHIMLRFEIENDLINGKVAVADLPTVWDDRFEAYMGIRPPTGREGVLQDIHWSQGAIGYFPDYLLGSIFSVQIWERMKADLPDATDHIRNGDFSRITAWLGNHIHRHGSKFTFPELAERVTGSALQWQPYMAYLRAKYSDIYGL